MCTYRCIYTYMYMCIHMYIERQVADHDVERLGLRIVATKLRFTYNNMFGMSYIVCYHNYMYTHI